MFSSIRTLRHRLPVGCAVRSNGFHSAGKKNSSSTALDADSKSATKLFHHSGLALAILTPIAFAVSPSALNVPVDMFLGILFPFHSYVAVNYVITDYVPKATRGLARGVLMAATVIAAAGMLKLNVQGPGLTESIKALWRKPQPQASDK